MSETEAATRLRETTHRGLTHSCEDPECHVPGFVTTLRRMSAAEVDWRTLPEPTDDAAVARKRIADFCRAVHTLYGEENPQPDGLIIDSTDDWSRTTGTLGLSHPRHHLLLDDLETLLTALAPAPAGDSGGERG